MIKEKIQWHPGFVSALQLEFKEYKKYLEYIIEHELTQKPLKIDLVVIKKLEDVKIEKTIGKILGKYNIFEYKSPTDYLSISDYYKVKSYAYLYKVLNDNEYSIDIEDMTITLTSTNYPQKLIKYLKNKNIKVEKKYSGIYYIEGTDITTQLVVIKELDQNDAEYLKLLQKEHKDKQLLRNWIIEYFNNSKEQLYLTIMDILTDNNLEEIMEEVKNMGMAKLSEDNMNFLMDAVKKFELDKKFTDKGIEQGIEQGRQDELLKTVTKQLTKKFGILPSDIKEKLDRADIQKLEIITDGIFEFSSLDEAVSHL
jgi:hypothetical protein